MNRNSQTYFRYSIVIAYTSGTINNIANWLDITPSAWTYWLSDIIEIRVYRDNANASTIFAWADPYTTDVLVTSVDIHYEQDTLWSRSDYAK